MQKLHPESDGNPPHESWISSRTGIVTIGALAILGFLVYTGHSAHLLGFVPYLFILACPLMHIFMHGGQHNHHAASDSEHGEAHKHGSDGCSDGDQAKKPGETAPGSRRK